ncbi:lipase, partial [Francisella tularensis subsp. holarctica]|nr:lipase [Francisella tularensis subsp. holarctica]
PKVLQNFNNITSKKIDMGKVPLTPYITTAILTAESITLCKNPQEFVFWDGVHPTYQIHKSLFKYISKEYLGIRL